VRSPTANLLLMASFRGLFGLQHTFLIADRRNHKTVEDVEGRAYAGGGTVALTEGRVSIFSWNASSFG
jgi:hypothetical protein